MKLSEIHINPLNPRLIKDDRFKKLVKSISEFPKMMELRPIIIDSDMQILGGNMRFKALKELKYKDVPDEWVKRADELTDEEKQRFIIEDNVGFGEFDWEMLANEWDADLLADWGLELPTDFGVTIEATEDDYVIPEGEIKTNIVLGDMFAVGNHRIICGDSTNEDTLMKLMDGESADLLFTDPPYGMNAVSDNGTLGGGSGKYKKVYSKIEGDDKEFDASFLLQIPSKNKIIFGGNFLAHLFPRGTHWIVWDKRGAEMTGGKSCGTQSDCELAWTDFDRNSVKKYVHVWAGWFREGSKDEELVSKIHPTQKPVGLCKDIFNEYEVGNLILDPFLGSGSTLIACHQLNKKCYGMEIDPKYCQVIIDRMLKLDPEIIIKKNGVLI